VERSAAERADAGAHIGSGGSGGDGVQDQSLQAWHSPLREFNAKCEKVKAKLMNPALSEISDFIDALLDIKERVRLAKCA
jgi:hypothetical protein